MSIYNEEEKYITFFKTNENPVQRELLNSTKAQTQFVKAETEYTQVLKEAQIQRIQNMQTGMIVTVVFFVIIVLILVAMLIFLIIASTKGNCYLGSGLNSDSKIESKIQDSTDKQITELDKLNQQDKNTTNIKKQLENTPYPRFHVESDIE